MLDKIKELSWLARRLIPGEGETMAEHLRHLLETDPKFRAGFDRHIEAQLRQQYGAALQELRTVMQNPDREREVVWKLITGVHTSGPPALEHIPALIELECTARQVGGTAYTDVEKMVFEALTSVVRKLGRNDAETDILLSFLGEAFRYQRQHDNFAARRRDAVLEIVATVTALTGDKRALALLHEVLVHPIPKIRGVAAITIYETYDWLGCDVPEELVDRFWQMAQEDRVKQVRQTALAVLQQLGLISYEEAVERLEGKG